MKKNQTYILGPILLTVIFFLTYRILFSGQEFSEVLHDLRGASKGWIAAGAVTAVMFVACESCIIWYMLRVLQQRKGMLSCLKYSFIGFFFCYITPSSSGGQPAQMFYMKKDGIKIGSSALIMGLITIAYKSVLLLFGIIFFLFRHKMILAHTSDIMGLIIFGAFLNIALITLLILTLQKPEAVRRTGVRFITFLYVKKLIKKKRCALIAGKINRICENYRRSAEYLRHNRQHMIVVFLITVIERLCLFSITWIVYRSYGFSEVSFIDIIALQTAIGIAVEMLPLPGAAGITEGCFFIVFESIFTSALVRPALLLSRGLSFYLILILGGVITCASHIHGLLQQRNADAPHE